MSGQDPDTLKEDQLDREKFLEEFPVIKQDLEKDIEKIRAFADKVDKVHTDCTISKVVAHSTGAVSGILSIVGLALAPLTMGATLPLLATGLGLGIVSTVTNVSTSIVEELEGSQGCTQEEDTSNYFCNEVIHQCPRIHSEASPIYQGD